MVRELLAVLGGSYIFILLAHTALSWSRQGQGNTFARVLDTVTRPVLEPIRRHVPRVGGLDLSPAIAVLLTGLGIWFVRTLLS